MATQVTLGSGVVDSAAGLKLRTNGSTEAVDISTAQVVTLAKDAVVNGLTVGKGAGAVSTNTAVGASALQANTVEGENTVVGYQAGYSNTASYNTFFGSKAGYGNTTGQTQVGIGRLSLGGASAGVTGSNNTAVGNYALPVVTSGTDNSALGLQSLKSNTTGSYNVAVGRDALQANTTASYNTAVGYQAGYSGTTGQYNTIIGEEAGKTATTASNNTFLGQAAGYNTTGGRNTFLGIGAGSQVTSGASNTIIGNFSGNNGLDIRTASNYIVLSDGDGNPRGIFDGSGNYMVGTTLTGVIAFRTNGFVAKAGGSFSLRTSSASEMGLSGTSGTHIQFYTDNGTTYVGAGSISSSGSTTSYTSSSDYRLKENVQPMIGALAKVAALKPVTYTWKADGSDGEGFIAHELAEVCPQAVTGEKDAVDEEGNAKYQGIDTSFLVATLTAAIQELNAKVESQAAEIAALKGQA